ncbi:aminoglycoside phosphotransferase family protein [Heyndrickxia vini]
MYAGKILFKGIDSFLTNYYYQLRFIKGERNGMVLGSPIAVGNTAEIYLYENRIIKVFKDYLPKSEALYEATKQNIVYKSGLFVPKIVDVREINGKPAIVMEYIKGKTIGELLYENMEEAEYYMTLSVEVHQNIHSKSGESFEPMAEKLSRQIHAAPILQLDQKKTLIKRLELLSVDNKLCHGDFHFYNLIVSDNKVAIIDWVDASGGSRCADVYRTYLLLSQVSVKMADLYVSLYCEKSGLEKEEIFQWAPIIAGARLSENVTTERQERLLKIVNHNE